MESRFFPQRNPFALRWVLFPLSCHNNKLRAEILSVFPCFYLQWSRRIEWHDGLRIEFEQGVAFRHDNTSPCSMLSATMTATSSKPMTSAPPFISIFLFFTWLLWFHFGRKWSRVLTGGHDLHGVTKIQSQTIYTTRRTTTRFGRPRGKKKNEHARFFRTH